MCGIAGVFAPGRSLGVNALSTMLSSMSHRGPDDFGTQALAGAQLLFGHLRLSILDLSPLGHQPMTLADRKVWIVYNGEVYNFREIRSELETHGWRFRSDSDTEVVLTAYCQWGIDAVERFRGMFAFAIWDETKEELHLCRDRFGVKPLYYSMRNGTLAFASELKALNLATHTDRGVDPISALEYVRYGYVSAPRSIFSDVKTVRPGTICSIDKRLRVREREYWRAADLFDGRAAEALRQELQALPEEKLLDRVEASLQKAFEYRMVADVPVGVFLSGGIDSSLVAALLARRSGLRLRTFTIGFGDSEFDETRYARIVAKHLETEHVEYIVSHQAALDLVAEIPNIADEPIGDSSLIPTLMVSRLARQHVKVALSADGADELFGGYARYAYCGDFLDRSSLVKALYRLSANVIEQLPPALISTAYSVSRVGGPKFAAINDKLRKFVRMTRAREPFDAYQAAVSEWSTVDASRLLLRRPQDQTSDRVAFEAVTGTGVRDRFMHFDMTRYMPGDLLTKVDRASMSVSLEAREPFLDHEAAKLAAALPLSWKIRQRQNKFVLRKLLQRHFPASLFDRPKQGFSAPVGEWLRGPLRDLFMQELAPARVRDIGILDADAVQHAATEFLGSQNRSVSPAGAWILLQLQQWGGQWLRTPTGVAADQLMEVRAASPSV
ncbi:MAG TPA: asparagine synthase (glutamine-hydrolyzing) [Candidatus Acidoferrales bacterium]